MTISGFVQRTQKLIVLAATLRAVVVAGSAVLIVLAISAFLEIPGTMAAAMAFVSVIAVMVLTAWSSRSIQSLTRVALWVEETVPTLHYAIVTSAGRTDPIPELEQAVHIYTMQPFVTRRLGKVLMRSALLLAAASLVYLFSPATSLGRGRVRAELSRAFPGAVTTVNKIATIRVRIMPPSYSGLSASTQTNAASLTVLAGSRVKISGQGSPEGVSVTVDGMPVGVAGTDEWSTTFSATTPVSVIRAVHEGHSRLVVIEATPDKPPQVALTAPLRDTTLRSPLFSVVLRAETTDEIGLGQGYFEYLIVSGTGEAFSGRTFTSRPIHFESRSGRLQASLDFADLRVVAGDLVSVRAIVRDNNTITGPSVGTSDTRTFRVARADEYDSVSIEAAAPPPVDSSAMSQRMLILMTEALVKKQRALARNQLVKQSDDIGFMEDRIRKRVYDIIYQTDSPEGAGDTEEAESDLQAINNPDLKQAYDALWDAVRSLRIAEPAAALPPMRIALKALDRARLAKRLYLRGAAPRVVVDVARVRLTGKEKGASSVRQQQAAADSMRRLLQAGFEVAAASRRANAQSAIEQLSLLRVRALPTAPAFAAALRDVISALEKRGDVETALLRARRTLAPATTVPPVAEWGGG